MDKRGGGEEGGSITILCQNFLSHSAKKFRKATLLWCVSENFRKPKSL